VQGGVGQQALVQLPQLKLPPPVNSCLKPSMCGLGAAGLLNTHGLCFFCYPAHLHLEHFMARCC
jgi:hypothetical protein